MESAELQAEVLAVTPDGQPSRVWYKMNNPLDHPDYRWLIWRGLHYEEIELNFRIGEPVFFADPTLEMFSWR